MKNNIAKSSALIVAIGIISKIMGTVRQSLIASTYGQNAYTDSYNAAYKASMIAMIVFNSITSLVIIPLMAKAKEKHGIEGKNRFFNNITTVIVLINVIFAVVSIFGAPILAKVMAPGFEQWQLVLTSDMIKIMAPSVIFLGLSVCIGSYQQSNYSFGPYASVGIVNNIVFYIYLLTIGKSTDIKGLAIITLVGAVVQTVVLMLFTDRGLKLRPLIDVKDEYIQNAFILAVPLFASEGINQLNIIVTNALASGLDEGTVTVLDNAYKLFSAIMSLFVSTIATVVFPTLAEAANKKDNATVRKIVDDGMNVMFLALIPVTVGIIALSTPIVKLVYQRGAFTPEDTIITRAALICYSLGLVGNGVKIYLNKVYFSFSDSVTPMKNQILTCVISVILSFVLIGPLNFKGLALAQSLAACVAAMILIFRLKDKLSHISYMYYLVSFIKVTIASVIMGIGTYFIYGQSIRLLGSDTLKEIISVLVAVTVAIVIYLISLVLLKVDGIKVLIEFINKRRNKA